MPCHAQPCVLAKLRVYCTCGGPANGNAGGTVGVGPVGDGITVGVNVTSSVGVIVGVAVTVAEGNGVGVCVVVGGVVPDGIGVAVSVGVGVSVGISVSVGVGGIGVLVMVGKIAAVGTADDSTCPPLIPRKIK